MHLSSKLIDNSELGTTSDTQIAKKYGLSKERIRQIRKKKNIEKYSPSKEKTSKLIEYIKINYEMFDFKEALNKFKYVKFEKNRSNRLSKSLIKKIATKLNLELKFKGEKERYPYIHSLNNRRDNKCACKICKLSKAIWVRFHKYDVKLKTIQCDYYANEYIEMYEKDKTQYKSNFYLFIENDLNVKMKSNVEILSIN